MCSMHVGAVSDVDLVVVAFGNGVVGSCDRERELGFDSILKTS